MGSSEVKWELSIHKSQGHWWRQEESNRYHQAVAASSLSDPTCQLYSCLQEGQWEHGIERFVQSQVAAWLVFIKSGKKSSWCHVMLSELSYWPCWDSLRPTSMPTSSRGDILPCAYKVLSLNHCLVAEALLLAARLLCHQVTADIPPLRFLNIPQFWVPHSYAFPSFWISCNLSLDSSCKCFVGWGSVFAVKSNSLGPFLLSCNWSWS